MRLRFLPTRPGNNKVRGCENDAYPIERASVPRNPTRSRGEVSHPGIVECITDLVRAATAPRAIEGFYSTSSTSLIGAGAESERRFLRAMSARMLDRFASLDALD